MKRVNDSFMTAKNDDDDEEEDDYDGDEDEIVIFSIDDNIVDKMMKRASSC